MRGEMCVQQWKIKMKLEKSYHGANEKLTEQQFYGTFAGEYIGWLDAEVLYAELGCALFLWIRNCYVSDKQRSLETPPDVRLRYKDKPVVYETMGGELGPWLQAQHETHAGQQHIPPAGEGGGEYA